jgi:hypothetical protein
MSSELAAATAAFRAAINDQSSNPNLESAIPNGNGVTFDPSFGGGGQNADNPDLGGAVQEVQGRFGPGRERIRRNLRCWKRGGVC